MSGDLVYYYDFAAEETVEDWAERKREGQLVCLETTVTSPGEDVVLLYPFQRMRDSSRLSNLLSLSVNGVDHDLISEAETSYVMEGGTRWGLRVTLLPGENILQATVHADAASVFSLKLIPDLPPVEVKNYHGKVQMPPETMPEPTASSRTVDLTGYQPGCGTTQSPGRFGFSKGDGVLDCAMPCLGIIDKMYVCGHPNYHKPFRWSYAVLPEHAKHHGTYPPATCGIDHDRIHVNHLTVTWETTFDGQPFSCTYSLGSPGIITESTRGYMRLSKLEYAGNYQFAMIPTADGIDVLSLDLAAQGFHMAENWILLFGCTEFPDLPLMVVLDREPKRMDVKRHPHNGRLAEIIFHGNDRMVTATPFGFEFFNPIAPDNQDFLKRAARQCRFWSHAFMAYPTQGEDYFKIDRTNQRVDIIQTFSYRHLQDPWNTQPLELAPVPPVLTLCGTAIFDDQIQDFHFPTKYGHFKGTLGHVAQYSIPFMNTERKFPLKDADSGQKISELLHDGLQDFFDFAAQFPEDHYAYPYAGALVEPYALATTMMNFMDEQYQTQLRRAVAKRLENACQEDRQYKYPVINHSHMMKLMPQDDQVRNIYTSPDMTYRHLWNWYERKEPFTGRTFHICYLNLSLISSGTIKEGTREEIRNSKIPLIENDWGVGLTFYYMYFCALATGDFSPIKRHWEQLKSVYRFFSLMHDWACMGTGYSDNGILWVEGANLGAFTSFIHFAEAVGDQQALDYGIYLAAKQLVLRLAVFKSAQDYFHVYYGVKPWYVSRLLLEESNPSYQFQNYPEQDLQPGRFRRAGVYNLTTEGLYPELFEMLQQHAPKDHDIIMEGVRNSILHGEVDPTDWCLMQPVASLLISEALNPNCTQRQFNEDLRDAENHKLLMTCWRGIHIFSRRLPQNYFKAQLLAWQDMKKHQAWLEHWENLTISTAIWKDDKAVITLEKQPGESKLCLGVRRKPSAILLNGKSLSYDSRGKGKIDIHPNETGNLVILFNSNAHTTGTRW